MLEDGEMALQLRAQEIGLSGEQTELLLNLLGWRNRDKSVPDSFEGLEPHCSMRQKMAWSDEREAAKQAVSSLLRYILGEERISFVAENPLEVVCDQYKLGILQISWLRMQLGLPVDAKDGQTIVYTDPALFDQIIVPVVNILLQPST